MTQCTHCQRTLPLTTGQNLSFREDCPFCSQDLHICKMCQFYDPSVSQECRETEASPQADKLKRNFCEYFRVGIVDSQKESQKQNETISALESLFKK